MATLTEHSDVTRGDMTILMPQQHVNTEATETESTQLYASVTPPIEEEGGGLRSRVPNTISLEEAKQIQKEYEAPFRDLIHQNPIKAKDFRHPPSWFQDSPFAHNLRLAVGIFPALFVILSLSGRGLLATLCIGALSIYFTLNFSLPKHSLLVCLITIISAEVS